MQTARHGGRHVRYSLDDGELIVIDRDTLIRSALFIFFSVPARSDANALLAQAYILVHGAVCSRQSIPFQYFVLLHILADEHARPIFLNCLNTILDFVALHEIGHVYADQKHARQAFFHLETEPSSGKSTDQTQYAGYFRRAWGIQREIPISDRLTVTQIKELLCDAFALNARTIMDSSGQFSMAVLDALSTRLFLLSRFLFLEDMGVMHGEGPSGQVNLGRVKTANREVPIGQPLRDLPSHYNSHPSGILRLDSLLLHAEWIFDELGVPRNPLEQGGDTTLVEMTRELWGNGIRLLQDILVDILRTPESKDGSFAAEFDYLVRELNLECQMPSSLKGFAFAALVPYLGTATTMLGKRASAIAPTMKELASRHALSRLPSELQVAKAVDLLCSTLLDPAGTIRAMRASAPPQTTEEARR